MIIPVRCFTCGKVLADKYEFYKREVGKSKTEDTIINVNATISGDTEEKHLTR